MIHLYKITLRDPITSRHGPMAGEQSLLHAYYGPFIRAFPAFPQPPIAPMNDIYIATDEIHGKPAVNTWALDFAAKEGNEVKSITDLGYTAELPDHKFHTTSDLNWAKDAETRAKTERDQLRKELDETRKTLKEAQKNGDEVHKALREQSDELQRLRARLERETKLNDAVAKAGKGGRKRQISNSAAAK